MHQIVLSAVLELSVPIPTDFLEEISPWDILKNHAFSQTARAVIIKARRSQSGAGPVRGTGVSGRLRRL